MSKYFEPTKTRNTIFERKLWGGPDLGQKMEASSYFESSPAALHF